MPNQNSACPEVRFFLPCVFMLDLAIEARKTFILPGMDVKRIPPFLRSMVGPFIFMDHAGPIEEVRHLSNHTKINL